MSALALSHSCCVSSHSQPALARRRLVLVDDEPSILEVWGVIFTRSGYDVQCFADPRSALEAIDAGCDVVITDYHMPGMTGLELIRAARGSKAKFIVVTANISDAVAEEAKSAGAECVMHKPTSAPMVLQRLAKLG